MPIEEGDDFLPVNRQTLALYFNSSNGESLADQGSKNLGSFVKGTVNTFSLFIGNAGTSNSILSIPQNGMYVGVGSSGLILTNPTSSGPLDILFGSAAVPAIITINSESVGNKFIPIIINSNDLQNPRFDYTFFLTITEPIVSSSDIAIVYDNQQVQNNSVVYLGAFPKDGVSDLSFKIFNYAISDLIIPQNGITITKIGSNENFIVNPSSSGSVTLSFNNFSEFKIRLDNSSVGNKSAVVLITSNDPDKNPFIFTISYSIAKPFDLIIKESLLEVFDGDSVNLGSFNKKSIINRNISMSNRGISYGIKLLNIFGEGDVVLTNIPSLPYVLQPNEANAVQFIAKFGSLVIGKRNASLKIQWEVSSS